MDVPKHRLVWISSVISYAYESAFNEDHRSVRVGVHEVRKIATSLLFRQNCAIQQVLKAGTWLSQSF